MKTQKTRQRTGSPFGSILATAMILAIIALAGCARYNTYHNAKKYFNNAEHAREQRIRKREDVSKPTTAQVDEYQKAIKKCQYLLEEYPGHGLTDDALFLMAKSYHRIQSYRMSISRMDLLFQNFPSNKFLEEAIFLQAINYMFIGNADASSDMLTQLSTNFPGSRFQAEALRLSGDNAYALEKWALARDDYSRYLADVSGEVETGEVEYKLAQCHWELKEYGEAAALLRKADPESGDKEIYLDKKLLLARCLVRTGDYDQAAEILDASDEEAAIYTKSGMVLMIRAESLVARGKADEAATLIENISDEWRTKDVAARLGEILGQYYLDQWRLEDAQGQFRATLRDVKILEDPDYCRRVSSELGRYLQMENRLDSATPEQAPSLKLVQANVMLGALKAPRRALELYLDLIETADLDSSSAIRGLYGAALIYRDYLDLPDSSAMMVDRLLSEFPASPQAFEMDSERGGDLFTYLMELEQERLVLARAAAAVDSSGVEASEMPPEILAQTPPPDPQTAASEPATGRRRHHRRPRGKQ